MPYLVHRLHLCYFTEGGIEGQDLVGCVLGYQLKEGFSMAFSYCSFKLFRNLSDSYVLRQINIFTVRMCWKRSSRVV